MEKKFMNPELEIIEFVVEDVIVASGEVENGGGQNAWD